MKQRRVKATKAEQARYAKLHKLGCIIDKLHDNDCNQFGIEIQHFTSGGRRLGNEQTIPLCIWHHQGKLSKGYTTTKMTSMYGPSFAKSRREFEGTYGSEEFLLSETNRLLEGM